MEVRNAGTGGGNVYINVSVGNAVVVDYAANYLRQDHPRKLVFGLEVTSGMNDVFGLCIGAGCDDDTIALAPGAAIVAAEDGVAAVTSFDAVETSWSIFGSIPGLTGGVCDRHPAVRDAIVAKISAASTCAEVTDAQVNAIGSLDLSGEGIAALRKEDFEGLTSLHTLDLSGNALDHLPADLFEPLDPSLLTLKLNGNPLGALPAGLFDGLTGIQELDLADTGLTELPAGLFADLDSLQELRLVENRLRAFPAAALADVAGTLRDLFMRDNDIPSIAAGALDGMTRLRKLELQDNALASLPAGLFDDATELRELKLNDNALASLPDDLLRPLTKLEVVRLQGNPGFDGFAPVVEAIPAQSVERGVRVDLEAVLGASPWGDNVTWTQTDSSGTTVTLNDADTATPWFDAPVPNAEKELAFEATARGRGTSGANASEGAATAQVTVPGLPSIVDVSVTSRPRDGSNTFKRGDHIEVTFTFSEPVRARGPGLINFLLRIGVAIKSSAFHRSDHPNRLTFRYVVDAADRTSVAIGLIIGTDNTTSLPHTGVSAIIVRSNSSIRAVSDNTNARLIFDVTPVTWHVNGGTVAPTGGVCDRQHKVRDAIVAAVSAASTCAAVTDTHLAGIASLDLSGEAIDSLRKADFAGLAGLTELDLSGNALDYLPGDLFEHVPALTDLTLQGKRHRRAARERVRPADGAEEAGPAGERADRPARGGVRRSHRPAGSQALEQRPRLAARLRVRAAHEAGEWGAVDHKQSRFRGLRAADHGQRAGADGAVGGARGPRGRCGAEPVGLEPRMVVDADRHGRRDGDAGRRRHPVGAFRGAGCQRADRACLRGGGDGPGHRGGVQSQQGDRGGGGHSVDGGAERHGHADDFRCAAGG